MSISENIKHILSELPANVRLVAVSKTKPCEDILEAYNGGQRIFGENKVQEMTTKQEQLPSDIEWHMIGHLQTNKVKYIAPYVSLIHSVDSLHLLEAINKEAMKHNRIIDCLLQIHIATEETKFGFDDTELNQALSSPEFAELKNVRIVGLMGMATNTDDTIKIHHEFGHLHQLFQDIKKAYYPESGYFKELSMGMSGDYKIAIEEGSTLVRIGSAIFGARNYPLH
ncbi:MAG: YggS family pyridoxal phosphate-dependent enzyme [Bacteroidota bacterium]|nr:YggS family pyridoxal phosphate-dependent enzyme [Bacteroidota bacterium]